MKIEMQGQGSEAFYREVVNIVSQYSGLMKRPEAPLRDNFSQMKRSAVISVVLFAVLSAMTIFWGASVLTIIALTLTAVNIAFCASHLINLNRSLKGLMADTRKTALVFDGDGVAVEKDGAQTVRFAWESIAFARKFGESLALFSGKPAGVITANLQYEEEIMKYLKEKKPDIRMIS